jgi:hypothetical protein
VVKGCGGNPECLERLISRLYLLVLQTWNGISRKARGGRQPIYLTLLTTDGSRGSRKEKLSVGGRSSVRKEYM